MNTLIDISVTQHYFIYILFVHDMFLFIPTVLTPADESHHIDKHKFTVPFVCGARDLGEALRRISEGAAMIRTKGQAGTGEDSFS